MRVRNGTTLVEMLVAITVGGTLFALGAGMVHQSMLISRATALKCDRLHSATRFFEQFRLDVHSAIAIDCTSNLSMSIKSDDGSKIAYATESSTIKRTQVRKDGTKHYEVLTLDERAVGVLNVRDEAYIAALVIQTHHDLIDGLPRLDRCIEAVIGRGVFELASKGDRP